MWHPAKMRIRGEVSAASATPIGGIPLVEILDNRRVIVENHIGITDYEASEISVKVRKGTVKISGDHLEILCMSKERIVICGTVFGVQFGREDLC